MQPWTLLQLADTAFPIGGLAHSGGLDAAVQLGRVRTPDDVFRFVEEALRATGGFALPFVSAARADPWSFAVLDGCCDASLPDLDANRVSREQGRAFLDHAATLSLEIERLVDVAHRSGTPGHLAPAFGAVVGLLGGTDEDAAHLFLFLGARGILSAAVDLGLIGPVEAQSLLARAAPVMSEVLALARLPDATDAVEDVEPLPPPQQRGEGPHVRG